MDRAKASRLQSNGAQEMQEAASGSSHRGLVPIVLWESAKRGHDVNQRSAKGQRYQRKKKQTRYGVHTLSLAVETPPRTTLTFVCHLRSTEHSTISTSLTFEAPQRSAGLGICTENPKKKKENQDLDSFKGSTDQPGVPEELFFDFAP